MKSTLSSTQLPSSFQNELYTFFPSVEHHELGEIIGRGTLQDLEDLCHEALSVLSILESFKQDVNEVTIHTPGTDLSCNAFQRDTVLQKIAFAVEALEKKSTLSKEMLSKRSIELVKPRPILHQTKNMLSSLKSQKSEPLSVVDIDNTLIQLIRKSAAEEKEWLSSFVQQVYDCLEIENTFKLKAEAMTLIPPPTIHELRDLLQTLQLQTPSEKGHLTSLPPNPPSPPSPPNPPAQTLNSKNSSQVFKCSTLYNNLHLHIATLDRPSTSLPQNNPHPHPKFNHPITSKTFPTPPSPRRKLIPTPHSSLTPQPPRRRRPEKQSLDDVLPSFPLKLPPEPQNPPHPLPSQPQPHSARLIPPPHHRLRPIKGSIPSIRGLGKIES
ncbi:hypothetical protein BC829DRAFT_408054 [Chytridium lagenaria]|nr:hypothetical protein BC829DRAFT_408054 [Chytridium lagenaria]